MGKYNYLHKYIVKKGADLPGNFFYSLSLEAIRKAESELDFSFSDQLKEFWREVGNGFLNSDIYGNIEEMITNRLMPPEQILQIASSNDPHAPDNIAISSFYYERSRELEAGYIPFFEIGDSVSFLFMNPKGENPNAVYYFLDKMVASSFEEFIYKLYHESPTFYLYAYYKCYKESQLFPVGDKKVMRRLNKFRYDRLPSYIDFEISDDIPDDKYGRCYDLYTSKDGKKFRHEGGIEPDTYEVYPDKRDPKKDFKL